MTAARDRRRAGARPGDGGVAARRAVLRWALRLFCREWRQQLLVLVLLTLTVTAAVGGASLAYHLGPLWHTARFGEANQMFTFYASDLGAAEANVAAVAEQFGTVDVIGHRNALVPGSAEIVEFRAQDPQGAYGASMLALLDGRDPAGAGEVAVTDAVARLLDLDLGSRFALAGSEWTVVGLVENPDDLSDEFVLVAPAHAPPPETVTVLVLGAAPPDFLPPEGSFDWSMADQTPDDQQVAAAATALGAAAVAMVLVALVASAGFVVLAQRRQRQLGMLAAIGATSGHLRLVMLANGAAVGVVAAVTGTAVSLVGWVVLAPRIETAVNARIDRFDLLPWWLVAIGMLLAVAAATAAAWWPARAVARIPVTVALSGRPARPRPVRRSAAWAGLSLMVGVTCLVLAGRANALLIGIGTVATALGVLAVSPLAVRALAGGARRLPVAGRLALRDLARYQTRSAAALAAISLALGIAATVVITVTAAERTADEGNLSAGQLLVTEDGGRIRELVTVRTPAQTAAYRAQVDRMADPLGDPAVITLEMAVDPTEDPHPGRGGMQNAWRHAVEVGDGERTANPGPLFVATPELLELYGVAPDTIGPDTGVLTVRTGDIGLRLGIEESLVTNVETLDVPAYTAAPTSLITPAAVRRHGWEPAVAGWLIDAGQPLTSEQVAQAHTVAASAGMQIMARDGENLAALGSLRSGAMAVGMIVALAVLAMSVGLIRSEAAGDLRTLTATGATGRIRRTLTAVTAGALALLGVTLGILGAYLALAAGFVSGLDTLLPVPVLHLLALAAGVPVTAAAAGWLLGGRQPSTLARQPTG